MFFPRNVAKVFMQPGAVQGETNGLYAAVTVNVSRGVIVTTSTRPATVARKTLGARRRGMGPSGWAGG